jgi:hypothetical protein
MHTQGCTHGRSRAHTHTCGTTFAPISLCTAAHRPGGTSSPDRSVSSSASSPGTRHDRWRATVQRGVQHTPSGQNIPCRRRSCLSPAERTLHANAYGINACGSGASLGMPKGKARGRQWPMKGSRHCKTKHTRRLAASRRVSATVGHRHAPGRARLGVCAKARQYSHARRKLPEKSKREVPAVGNFQTKRRRPLTCTARLRARPVFLQGARARRAMS